MNGTSGLSAWRWLFILEGLPSLLSAIAVFFLLPDYPETSSWLSPADKQLAADRLRLEGSHGQSEHMTWADAKATLLDLRLWAHYIVSQISSATTTTSPKTNSHQNTHTRAPPTYILTYSRNPSLSQIYFGISTPFSSLSLFTPTITAGLGYTGLRAQLMTVPPYAVSYILTLLVSHSADRFNARALHSALFATIGGAGFLASALLPPQSYSARYGALIVAASGSFSCIPPLLGWLSSNLFSTGAVGLAIALNVSFGAPGQIVGVWIYKAGEKERGYPTGHWVNCGLLFFVAVGCLGLGGYYRGLNVRVRREGGGRFYKY